MTEFNESKIKNQTKENKDQRTKSKRIDRIKPLCDSSPSPEVHPSVRVPENRKIVKGVFKNMECPGTMLMFSFRCYKEPIKPYYLMDGGTYELPIEVVEHLNSRCGYKQFVWNKEVTKLDNKSPFNPDQKNLKRVENIISRFAFTPNDCLMG